MTLPPEHELACRELVERVTAWLDGALSPAERRRFEAHLAACAGCFRYVEQLRALLRLARHLGRRHDASELPEETRAGVLAAFRGYRGRSKRRAPR